MAKNQTYELTYLISSAVDEKAAQGSVVKIKELVDKENIDSQKEELKKIKLAYPIKKQGQAFLATLKFNALPEVIKTLEAQLEKVPEILRFILIKKQETKILKPVKIRAAKEEKPGPSVLASEKELPPQKEKVGLEQIEKELDKIL